MSLKVSIIIATFNSERTLRNALESVACQTFQDWECLVVDGASEDKTINIVKEYIKKDCRFRYVSEPDRGVYDAFNKGWKLAKGEWIYYLGDDDVLTKNGLADLLKFESGSIDVLSGHCYVKKIDGTIKHSYSKGMFGCHQGKIMRRSLLERFDGFDMQYKILADADLMLRLENFNVPVKVVNTFVAYFSMDGMSQELKFIMKMFLERVRINRNNGIRNPFRKAFSVYAYKTCSILYRRILILFKRNTKSVVLE